MDSLQWNETELVEFFSSLADYSEDCESYGFGYTSRGIQLRLTLFPLEGAAYVSLHRDDEAESLITLQRERCTHAYVMVDPSGRDCVLVGSADRETTDRGQPPVLTRGLRVFIRPEICVEEIESPMR